MTLLLTFLVNTFWQIAVVGAVAYLLSKTFTRLPATARYAGTAAALAVCVVLAVHAVPWPSSSPGSVVTGVPVGLVLVPRSALACITLLYAAFLVFRLGRLAHALRRATKLTRFADRAALPLAAETALERCLAALGVARPTIVWSASVSGPVTVGSSIVLPKHMRSERSEAAWTAVLGHELAHVERRDFAWNLVWEAATLPIAFHPTIVWLRRELDRTREQACDEAVTESLLDSHAYASSLVSVAQNIPAPPQPAVSVGISDGPSLEERIMRILNRRPADLTTKTAAALSLGLLPIVALSVSSFAFTVAANRRGEPRTVSQASADAAPVAPDGARALYDARGKRDPFLSPLGTKTVEPVGFDVESLALRGIVHTPNGATAMLQGPDQKTYFVKRGERFFNGTLVAIDGASLTFSVQTQDLFGASSTRDVVVPLHPEKGPEKK